MEYNRIVIIKNTRRSDKLTAHVALRLTNWQILAVSAEIRFFLPGGARISILILLFKVLNKVPVLVLIFFYLPRARTP